MMRFAHWRPFFFLVAAISVVQGAVFPRNCGQEASAAEPPPKDRQALAAMAQAKRDQAAKKLESGDYNGVASLLEASLRLLDALYPKAAYQRGHADIATTNCDLGVALQFAGDYPRALTCFDKALKMRRALYPADEFRDGHPSLVTSLNLEGLALKSLGRERESVSRFEEALRMCENLYAAGHPDFAWTLQNLGAALESLGDTPAALGAVDKALSMERRLYPLAAFPEGHPVIARTLNTLGMLYEQQGDYGRARRSIEAAIEMLRGIDAKEHSEYLTPQIGACLNNLALVCEAIGEHVKAQNYLAEVLALAQRTYPPREYPDGHPELANALYNLASVMQSCGDRRGARENLEKALQMCERLYRPSEFPSGHPMLPALLDALSSAEHEEEHYEKAIDYARRALEMRRDLARDSGPQGQIDVALSTNNLASITAGAGDLRVARALYADALGRLERVYEADYPGGHPMVASVAAYLAGCEMADGLRDEGFERLRGAVAMRQRLADEYYTSASEAEALNFAEQLWADQSMLICAAKACSAGGESIYPVLWSARRAIQRMMQARHFAAMGNRSSQEADLSQKLARVRRDLARGSSEAIHTAVEGRRRSANDLGDAKERLERELADNLSDAARKEALLRRPHTELTQLLPPGAVFVDLVNYVLFEQDPRKPGARGDRRTPSFAAFILASGRSVQMVDLGPAQPIDAASRGLRQAIAQKRHSEAGATLRQLVWQPIERALLPGTTTIYLAPDGALASVPWGALPGKDADCVLLEQYSFAVVPHGPFLLHQLLSSRQANRRGDSDTLLVVGDVAYDEKPNPRLGAETFAVSRAVDEPAGHRVRWPALPGTRTEINGLPSVFGGKRTIVLAGRDATTERVFEELPNARWAVFATHGFFADARLRSALQLDGGLGERRDLDLGGERSTIIGRNPLLLSGLVFAGANLPRSTDGAGIPRGDGGILTAEAIASLPLKKLDLVVLSACDTGLGEVAGGEGVFGLQRAFHQAGAANVVASLWKIDDRATAALMRLFYYKLFREGKPPLAALRDAQLAIYRHPEQIGPLAAARAPELGKAVKLIDGSQSASAPNGCAASRLWAGFVLSGAGT